MDPVLIELNGRGRWCRRPSSTGVRVSITIGVAALVGGLCPNV